MLNDRFGALQDYPFSRLTRLLAGCAPPAGVEAVNLSVGDPQHPIPALVGEALAATAECWNRYPPINGTDDWRQAMGEWLCRRYGAGGRLVDADRCLLPVSGSREGLFLLALAVAPERPPGRPAAVLMPCPFYAVYVGAAVMAGAEPVYLTAGRDTGYLPDLDALDARLLDRTSLFYLCTPANPQGAIAGIAYLQKALSLARRHGFVLVVDECYSEIYDHAPPPGALEAAASFDGGRLDNLIVFNSLSKRSNAAGLRSGFVAGDPDLIAAFRRLRGYAHAGMPIPVQAASAALWRDEAHVEANRARYRAKIDAAERIFGNSLGFYRPEGGFFLWLEVGDDVDATARLWREAGVRVLPGTYISQPQGDGQDPGRGYVRVALVHDIAVATDALARIKATLSPVTAA